MTDYDTLLDDETKAFVAETYRHYPPDTVAMSVDEQRAVYDKLCRAFFKGYPDGVRARDDHFGPIPIRWYEKAGARVAVVYFHGGGFVVGGLESHDDICAELCERTGFDVISVDYRLAPEHAHPAMFDDCLDATRAVLAGHDGPVVLCGDSAGGNLAAAVAHAMRGRTDRIIGQVLIYPGLGGDMSQGSYLTHAQAPLLNRDDLAFYKNIRLNGPEPTGDPNYAPLQDRDFVGLPPTVAFSAECDPLADDAQVYCRLVQEAGGKAHWVNETGLVHGYLRARSSVGRARESFDRIVAAVASLGQGDWSY